MKIPRKVELVESKPFFDFFKVFWEKHQHDFKHINLEHIIFTKDELQNPDPFNRYIKIMVVPREIRLFLPGIFYVLIVYDSFNFLPEAEREFIFYNCLFQIPKEYEERTVLRAPDYKGFYHVAEKFKSRIKTNPGSW